MVDTPPGGAPHPSSPPPPAGPTYPQAWPQPAVGPVVVPVRRSGLTWQRVLVMVGAAVFIAGCAVYMLFELGFNLGPTAFLIGLAASIIPVPVLVACFLWLDRYEPEPMRYLVFCFAWGAFVSTAASYQVNNGFAAIFSEFGLPDALVAVLVAPFIEELTKTLGPILLLIFRRREWSGITDGLVYCGLSAVGFAMVENIIYLGGHGYGAGAEQYGPASGAQQLLLVFIMRILLSGFAHPLFTAMAGIGLGIAARSASLWMRLLAPLVGLLLAMMLHGTWNLVPSLVQATGEGLILLYGYVGVMVPIFFGMVGLAVWLRSWEGRLVERTLPDYVRAGWLTPPEVASLASLGRRHSARRWARRVAGDTGMKAMQGYQFAATRLALLRDGLRRGLDTNPTALARSLQEERQLLAEISACRQVFVGRDPQAPVGIWDGVRYHLVFPDGVRRPVEAPEEPVVPVPVVLAPPPRPALPYGHQPPALPYGHQQPPAGPYGPPYERGW